MKNKADNKTAITITYDTEKLAALEMYIKDNDGLIESELVATIDKLYNRHVPPTVKQFLAFKMHE